MKLIANTADGHLFEISRYELHQVIGRRYGEEGRLEIGDQIEVSDMFRQLEELAGQDKDMTGIAEKLESIAKACRKQSHIIKLKKNAAEVAVAQKGK